MNIETKIQRGGKRLNSGRNFGTGKFGETTEVIRVPISQKPVIVNFLNAYKLKPQHSNHDDNLEFILPAANPAKVLLNLYSTQVPAGFPSPADDHVEDRLDLNEFFQTDRPSVFLIRVGGDSLKDLGIFKNDIAIVDRSLSVKIGSPIVARIDQAFTMKILSRNSKGKLTLLKANEEDLTIKNIPITDDMDFEIWGVITGSVRKF